MKLKVPQLSRAILTDLGRRLGQYFETRSVERNPRLDMLALIADAKLRNDPYLKGSCYEPSKQT